MITIKQISNEKLLELYLLDNAIFHHNLNFDVYKLNILNNKNLSIFGVYSNSDELLAFITTLDVIGETVDIINFGVHPQYRNQHLATTLLTEIIKIKQRLGYRVINLEVRVSNIPAFRLYEKLGFKTISLKPNYYADGEDGKFMQLKLTKEDKQ